MNLADAVVLTRRVQGIMTSYSWQAIPSSWEPGDPVGWGDTAEEARDNLLDLIQMRIDYMTWANPQGGWI